MSKALIRKSDKVIVMVFDDSTTITDSSVRGAYRVTVNGKNTLVHNKKELDIVENITLPEDFELYKYEVNNGELSVSDSWADELARREAERLFLLRVDPPVTDHVAPSEEERQQLLNDEPTQRELRGYGAFE